MFRATLIHSFAVYCMLLTLDIGFSTQQGTHPNRLVKVNMERVEIEKRENHNEDTIGNQNHVPHPRKEFKINTAQEHDKEIAHRVLVRFSPGSKDGPIDKKPKDNESYSDIDNNKAYEKNHYRALRHTETDDNDDELHEPPEDEHSESNENEDSKDSFEDADSDEKDANDDEGDTNENSTTDGITTPTNISNENDSTNNNSTNGGNSTTNGTVPDEWDWREKGFLTEVGNQGETNYCWAFATSGVLEGYNFIKTGQLETLSIQQLIDCDKVIEPEEDTGFNGAHSVNSSLEYVKEYGIETNESYPFTGQEGTECRYDAKKVATKMNKFNSLTPANEIEMQRILVTYGPIVVVIYPGDLKPNVYQGGIYEGCKTDTSNDSLHAVVAVGYGTDNGKDYWILKNSWGKSFGEQGYFKLPRNINACQITQYVYYVE